MQPPLVSRCIRPPFLFEPVPCRGRTIVKHYLIGNDYPYISASSASFGYRQCDGGYDLTTRSRPSEPCSKTRLTELRECCAEMVEETLPCLPSTTEDETSAGGRQTRQELASNSCGRLTQAPLDQAGFPPPPSYPMDFGENLSGLGSPLDTLSRELEPGSLNQPPSIGSQATREPEALRKRPLKDMVSRFLHRVSPLS